MGEKKAKQHNRERLLRENPNCIYCGRGAETEDHCPPRCFFEERKWPESYSFAACHACNQGARADEQVLAVLIRGTTSNSSANALQEWKRLYDAVRNNNPDILTERKLSRSRRDVRHTMRDSFGTPGDRMRREGWGPVCIGPLTQSAINRFTIKLGKALYYRHNKEILDGIVYSCHLNTLNDPSPVASLLSFKDLSPWVAITERGKKPLSDQFIYRFLSHEALGGVHAIVRFTDQFIFSILAVRHDLDGEIHEGILPVDQNLVANFRHDCLLKYGMVDLST